VQGTYRPATYGDGEMTRSVMVVEIDDGEMKTVSRYDGLVCMAGCGEVVMGEALAWADEDSDTSSSSSSSSSSSTTSDSTVVYSSTVVTTTVSTTTDDDDDDDDGTLPLDAYPAYESCQLSGETYTCSGWVTVEGGTSPYMIWINGDLKTDSESYARFTISGPKCFAVVYDVEVVDAEGEMLKETFYFDPNNEPDKSLFPANQQCGVESTVGGRP
jgi:hypothetical protein